MQFHEDNRMDNVDTTFFHELLHGIPAKLDTLEASFSPYLDRPVDELNVVERNILRIAAYEMQHCADVPYKVIINEAIKLSKQFGVEGGYKFVNAVLDKLARDVRAVK